MIFRSGRITASLVLAAAICMGMSGQSCNLSFPASGPLPGSDLEGLWALQRGEIRITFTWSANGGGETQTDSTTGQFEPLDPDDFPPALTPLVNQWNAGLADLNASLDAAFPEEVVVTFPQYARMRLTNPADTSKTGLGAINSDYEYFFLGDLAGGATNNGNQNQGAGAVLSASTITGSFDPDELTTEGEVARTLFVVLSGQNQNNLAFTAQISVDYTGEWVDVVPEEIAALEASGGFGAPKDIGG